MLKIKASNEGESTDQKSGFQKRPWKYTAIPLNKIIKELNQRNICVRTGSYNLIGLSKYTRADLPQISLEIMWLAILIKV